MVDKTIESFLTTLGIPQDHTTLYLALIEYGPLSPLQLSRKTFMPRTQVYRRLETMKSSGLVEEIVDDNRTRWQAVSPDRLRFLLKAKQDEINNLSTLFPQVHQSLMQHINRRQPDTKVTFYRGQDGIRQMVYNVLNAHTEVVGFSSYKFETAVGDKFAQRFYEEFAYQKLKMRDIYSDVYLESIGGVKYLNSRSSAPPAYHTQFESRYLPKKTLDITTQMDIYNDVVSFYNWHGTEIFGVEIHNAQVAKLQKQIFEVLWTMAISEKDLPM